MLTELTQTLKQCQALSGEACSAAATLLASPEIPEALKADFLVALSDKGETPAELAAFAAAFGGMAVDPGLSAWSSQAVDIVGTGGDHSGGFNISSLVVLSLACAGVPVIKHGNRGVTSKCGSADLLAGLGFDLGASPERLREALGSLGYVFLFAPAYHPAFKHIVPVRKALAAQGRRTIFNILGPLINPGRPAHMILGVYSPDMVGKLAAALNTLGGRSGLVVHGHIAEGRGIDEMTSCTDNRVLGFGKFGSTDSLWRPEEFGLIRRPFSDLQGADIEGNLALVDTLLAGRGPAGLVDTIAFNTAVSLWICGKVSDPREAIAQSRELLLGGAVAGLIRRTREFFGDKRP